MKRCLFITNIFCLLLAFGTAQHAAANSTTIKPLSDSLLIHPYSLTKKEMVQLNAEPALEAAISITSNSDEELHFYVFDLEGTLLYRIALKGREKRVVPNLRKGMYTYDIFRNDISIEQGSITVK